MIGVCLIAAFAIAAVTATGASAGTPEWGKCVAKAGGKYEDSNCQTKAKGKASKHEFEWEKGKNIAPVPFTGHSPEGAGGVLTTGLATCGEPSEFYKERVTRKKCEEGGGKYEVPPSVLKVKCANETSEGEAEGKNKISGVHVTFTGCTLVGPCTGANGEVAGEVKTEPLKGELGYINKATKEVGVVLTPAKKNGLFAHFFCLGKTDDIHVGVGNKKEGAWYEETNGSHGGYDKIISPITPVNEMTEEYAQVFTVNGASENLPQNLEGKPQYALEDYIGVPSLPPPHNSTVWQRAGEEITNIVEPSEPGEIKG